MFVATVCLTVCLICYHHVNLSTSFANYGQGDNYNVNVPYHLTGFDHEEVVDKVLLYLAKHVENILHDSLQTSLIISYQ